MHAVQKDVFKANELLREAIHESSKLHKKIWRSSDLKEHIEFSKSVSHSENRETANFLESKNGGILPISQSTAPKSLLKEKKGIDALDWSLPGQEPAYFNCEEWMTKGCLNVEEHEGGLAFVRRFQRRCHRAECCKCYESWAGREAGKIEWRLDAWSSDKVVHVIVSPSNEDISNFTYKKLRSKAYRVLKKSGIYGGSVIFHHMRELKKSKRWYFSPHFHVLGFGWVQGTKEGYSEHGWIVKNKGLRKTVSGTALYQLSHAGVHKKFHTVTWFGELSYNKVKVPCPESKKKCPECGSKLRPLEYIGDAGPPSLNGDYWLPPENWRYDVASEVSEYEYELSKRIFDHW